ncbi:MAG: imidazole glycerol phosphate synthase subunit HisH [bacterium]|nr:imidazole glycerol phosphate synthase subunit HisH [bacterium]
MIGIIDYGAGNLQSVRNALKNIGVESEFVSNAKEFKNYSGLILPGVGSFGEAMRQLELKNLVEPIREYCKSSNLMGICLGLQLLFEHSQESPGVAGIGVFKGGFKRFDHKVLKVPHVGWNSLDIKKKDGIFKDCKNEEYCYFVHSYYLSECDNDIIAATCNYGEEFVAAVEKSNVSACQFHPEKSGEPGLKMLLNFCIKCGEVF